MAEKTRTPLYRLLGWGYYSQREHNLWQQYLDAKWNRPNRSDHYLMRIAQRVHQGFVKEPNSVTLEMQKVKFDTTTPQQQKDKEPVYKSAEEAAHAHKTGKWAWLMGMARNVPEEYRPKVDVNIPEGERAKVRNPQPSGPPVASPPHPSYEPGERQERERRQSEARSMWD